MAVAPSVDGTKLVAAPDTERNIPAQTRQHCAKFLVILIGKSAFTHRGKGFIQMPVESSDTTSDFFRGAGSVVIEVLAEPKFPNDRWGWMAPVLV